MPKKEESLSSRDSFLGGLGLLFLTLLMFGDVLFSESTFILSDSGQDIAVHFFSWRAFAFNELRHGHLVLWNPYYLCGTPFFGNFESALFYPPNWLYLVLPPVLAVNLGIALHVFLAGLFT